MFAASPTSDKTKIFSYPIFQEKETFKEKNSFTTCSGTQQTKRPLCPNYYRQCWQAPSGACRAGEKSHLRVYTRDMFLES